MASYHLSAQLIRRSKGHNVVSAAAYRAGEKLRDEKTDKLFNYANRKGVSYSEIMTPENAPERLHDRKTLWNEVEGMEKRKDAQLAREINVALPHELDAENRKELVRDFVQEQFVDKGMIADLALHDPVAEKGDHEKNFHAHILLTLRKATEEGLDSVKTREWNSNEQIEEWREAWADHQNRYLERFEVKDRVDHRTLEKQRESALARGDEMEAMALDRTPEIHIGVRAQKLARKYGAGWNYQSSDIAKEKWEKFRRSRTEHNQNILDYNRKKAQFEHEKLLRQQVKANLQQARQSRQMNKGRDTMQSRMLEGAAKAKAQELLMIALRTKNRAHGRYYEYLKRIAAPELQLPDRSQHRSMERQRSR